MRRTIAALSIILATGCASAPPPATRLGAVTFAPGLGVDLAASTRTENGLYYRDLKVGTGPVANVGDAVTVYYMGALATGEIFDGTKMDEPAMAFRIERGASRPIPGFEQGTTGMRVGGMRQIIIPPELGYGTMGHGPVPPNAVLVFTVELVSVK
jgi:FKBP-type peptidyl-prolyl cis-trans isomerase